MFEFLIELVSQCCTKWTRLSGCAGDISHEPKTHFEEGMFFNSSSSNKGHSHVLPVTSSSSPSICIKLCTFYSASQFLVPTQIDSNRLRCPAGGPQFMMIMTCRPEGMLENCKKTYSENLRNTFL